MLSKTENKINGTAPLSFINGAKRAQKKAPRKRRFLAKV